MKQVRVVAGPTMSWRWAVQRAHERRYADLLVRFVDLGTLV